MFAIYMVTFTINIPQMLAYNSIYCLTPSFAQCCSILPGIRHRDHCEAPGRIRLQDGPLMVCPGHRGAATTGGYGGFPK